MPPLAMPPLTDQCALVCQRGAGAPSTLALRDMVGPAAQPLLATRL